AAVIARSLDNLTRYLGLAVFVAVLLAGVGVASGVYVYAKEKTAPVALLRCIGASAGETVAVYLIQTSIAAAAACLGAALGVLVQAWLPLALRDFLPVTTALALTPKAVGLGTLVGIGTALLFALLPLLPLRNVSPLQALRSAYEENRGARDPLLWLLFCIIVAAILSFAFITAERWFHALYFTAGVLLAFGFIAFLARTASVLMKRLLSDFLPFAWRQGLANLHRPNNQTVAIMLAIGVAAFLLMTLYNLQSTLLLQVAERGGQGEPNLVLFDVQKEQRAGIAELVRSFGARDYGEVPIVTLRLAAIKGKRVEEIRNDGTIPPWALRREYRSTYRERLVRTERITQGTWRDRVAPDTQAVPISLEKGIAGTLRVGLNDLLEFELQGVPLITQVASIREVDWQRVQPNFFVVFPVGVLEQAPQFYAVVSRIESPQRSAALQSEVAERFPNVSMIDLTLILNTLDAILGRVERAIRFVALFTILTGLAVLASAILSRRGQRITESVLLRALGASKRQVLSIIATEYLFLGAFSCLAGAALAALASWALSFYFLGTVARFATAPVLWVLLLTTATVLLFGAMGCWGIFRRPALEALRAET
ncbi:MAG TPA: FtsX-like permease family protein, partial [Candidatus Binatia bacterium]|nr:FtsX-like permease family protein [Candidatus Binatia bacterium]